jgi:hypothetical protein
MPEAADIGIAHLLATVDAHSKRLSCSGGVQVYP